MRYRLSNSFFIGGMIVLANLPIFATDKRPSMPAFETVSIRRASPLRTVVVAGKTVSVPAGWKPCEYSLDRLNCRMPLWGLLREAFQVQEFEISAPGWTKDDMFEIQATMPLDTSKDEARLMLRGALEERFGLQYHQANRVTTVYALVPAHDGVKLKEPDPGHPERREYSTPSGALLTNQIISPGRYFSAGTPLDIFARNLQAIADLDCPVINETGLSGKYVIDLTWKSTSDSEDSINVVDHGILHAMKEKLGLELVRKSIPRNYLLIDHVNREPSEN